MEDVIHLHKDYNTSFCGEDASHIPMTYLLGDTTCDVCKEALKTTRDELTEQHQTSGSDLERLQSEITPLEEQVAELTAKLATLKTDALAAQHTYISTGAALGGLPA